MSIVELERQPRGHEPGVTTTEEIPGTRGRVRSFESGARTLLEELWGGRLIADTPEDQWLVRRVEEALAGLDDIRAITAGNDPEPVGAVTDAVSKVSIRADRSTAVT